MKLLNELLNLTEAAKGITLVGLYIYDSKTMTRKLVTDQTKNENWDGDFDCSNVKLTSLKDTPMKVTGDFECRNTLLTSLKGAPKEVTGKFDCSHNPEIISLDSDPKKVGGNFNCSNNPKLASLKGIHKQLTIMDGQFWAHNTQIKSHVLGLLLIKGCTGVTLDNKEVQDILNKYLPNTRGNKGLFECQSELLDADLEDYAEL